MRQPLLHVKASTPAEAKVWAKEFRCTVAELRIAMRAVGNSTDRVRAYLEALKGGAATMRASTLSTSEGQRHTELPLPAFPTTSQSPFDDAKAKEAAPSDTGANAEAIDFKRSPVQRDC